MDTRLLTYFKWCVALLLIGRGILHFTAPQPYIYLFENGATIHLVFGTLLLAFGLLCLLPNTLLTQSRWTYLLAIPTFLLIIQSLGSYVKSGYVAEQFVEHSLQMALPSLLVLIAKARLRVSALYTVTAVFISLTFIGHAFFALGYHYVPDNFLEMTQAALPLGESSALHFLYFIGWLDLVFALLVFVPFIRNLSIWYLIVWGILTSLARTYCSFVEDGITTELFTVNLPNTIYRLPHGLIPAVMYILVLKVEQYQRPVLGIAARSKA